MTQLSFVPESVPSASSSNIPTADLHCEATTAPSWLVDSIRHSGIVSPVIVGDKGDEGYVVIDGRRRVAAARALKLDHVPCRVYDYADVGSVSAMWAAALNELRASNPVTNLEAVIDMNARGASVAQISIATGLTAPTVSVYQAVAATAGPVLIEALKTGKTKFSTVRLALKLDSGGRSKCEAILAKDGKLTSKDVRNLIDLEVADLPRQESLPAAWRAQVAQTLIDLVLAAPAGEETGYLTDIVATLKES